MRHYELIRYIEDGGNVSGHKIKDFYRLKVYTERMARFLQEKTGKDVPAGSVVKLTCDELMRLYF